MVWGSIIFVLVLLNLWKWLPRWKEDRGFSDKSVLTELTLNFPDALEPDEQAIHRDIFAFGSSNSASGLVRVRPTKNKAVPIIFKIFTPTPSPTNGSLTEMTAGYRLLGMLSRGGQSLALIGKGDQTFQVKAGDEIDGFYRVQSITESEVYLTEKQTGNTLQLHIQDQQKGAH